MYIAIEITEYIRTQNGISTWKAMILHSLVHSDYSLRLLLTYAKTSIYAENVDLILFRNINFSVPYFLAGTLTFC